MADEITYDRVEEAEQAILEAISGVGDTVNGLPDSLDVDFIEVKEAISDVKTDVGNVNTAVGGVKEDTTSIKSTVDTNPLLAAGSAIKSIQRGYNQKEFSSGTTSFSISISEIDIEKSIGIFNLDTTNEGCLSAELKSSSIFIKKVAGTGTVTGFVSWQVIEFY